MAKAGGYVQAGNGAGTTEALTQLEQTKIAEQQAEARAPARIKVIGVGGGGCNCVRRMMDTRVRGVEYVMVNTDIKSLETAHQKAHIVQIGTKVTRGWGAGGDTKIGEKAAEESVTELRAVLKNAELVFVTSGMGGGTGTGAAPFVAQLAKEMDALVVGVVTTPSVLKEAAAWTRQ